MVGQGGHDAGFGDEEAAGIAGFCPAVNQALTFTFSFSFSLGLILVLVLVLVRHFGSIRRFLVYRLPIIPDNIYMPSPQARFIQEGICDFSVKCTRCVVYAYEFEYGEVVFEGA